MMQGHAHVVEVEQLTPSRYDITLEDGTEIKVFMTDVYEFTVSDYTELHAKFPEVNCIVSASNWNHFTDAARAEARGHEVATFHFKGLMGALNYRDREFLNYPDAQY